MVKKADIPKHIVKHALDLAAERHWAQISMRDVASAARVPLATVQAHYPTKHAILEAFTRQITAEVLADEDAFDADEPPRDRLFDILMRRFDALAPYKPALTAILRDVPREGLTTIGMAPAVREAMAWMLEAAGIPTGGLAGEVRTGALMVVWLATMRVWVRDDSPDLARTMATLDRHLRRADRMIGGFPGKEGPVNEAA